MVSRRKALQRMALAALGGGYGMAYGAGARWRPWSAQRPTPRLSLLDVDGAPWSLDHHAGKPVLLNFWASWCEPCRAEMPTFVALQERFQDLGFKVAAVNFKESAETVRRFRDARPLPLVWLRDSYGEAAQAFGVRTFPGSVLINRQGRAVLLVEGEVNWGDPGNQQRLAAYL